MAIQYKALAIEQLIDPPSRLKSERTTALAGLLTDALNRMAADGWALSTTYRSASGTIFIFERCKE
ncbi:hypothetical protein [Rubinisphaera sp.]|uniref:hypothetical protein n=1 Tax=Rubinisphaera sp. TaxID=2024857 RepID=UPI000C0E76DE|nr:hypothetical protein [Rubinisphaera sp.]MBV11910.1 hypothetical protein [Rubinisphaera sp.]HCS51535.1 hypothetical protein [Planctomycetaceae bacterium]|tara:strand:- start:371 stop:568 length:198 start_codon:yes stop_codon:yes gene_type:complete